MGVPLPPQPLPMIVDFTVLFGHCLPMVGLIARDALGEFLQTMLPTAEQEEVVRTEGQDHRRRPDKLFAGPYDTKNDNPLFKNNSVMHFWFTLKFSRAQYVVNAWESPGC
jgi:hypothetical protein